MGSWDVSCALTATPIFPGDECVFVLFNRTFNPIGHLEYDARFDVELVIKSTYADYGRPANVDGVDPQYLDAVTDCLGRDGQEPGRYFFFVCKKAWDWAVSRYPQKHLNMDDEMTALIEELELSASTWPLAQKYRERAQPPFQYFSEMQSVFHAFRQHHRTPLAGYWATGQYYLYFNEILSHMELVVERLLDLSRTNLEDDEAERKATELLAFWRKGME